MENAQLNKTVSRILSTGIYLTIFFYVAGLLLMLLKYDNFNVVQENKIHNFIDFIQNILRLEPEPFLYSGTITLIMTPILRVFISVIYFYKNRDIKFFYITLIVSVILIISILMGIFFSLKLG